jgi:hypothetical protein
VQDKEKHNRFVCDQRAHDSEARRRDYDGEETDGVFLGVAKKSALNKNKLLRLGGFTNMDPEIIYRSGNGKLNALRPRVPFSSALDGALQRHGIFAMTSTFVTYSKQFLLKSRQGHEEVYLTPR